MIHNLKGGGIFKIEPLIPYPADYDELVSQGEKEVERKLTPALKNNVEKSLLMTSFLSVTLFGGTSFLSISDVKFPF